MSLLLLFNARQAGIVTAAAAVLTLTAPAATVEASGTVTLNATPCVLTVSAPTAGISIVLQATPCVLSLSPPAPAVVAGTGTLNATANVLTLSTGVAALVSDLDVTATKITIAGVQRHTRIRPESLTITDNLNESPNLCTFVAQGFTPLVGQEIVIILGAPTSREFGGHLTVVEQIAEGQKPANVAYHCEAVDYTRLLDRRLVHARYPSQSATTTVQQVIASFASGFTTGHVATSLPAIAQVDFDWEPVSRVLTRLAQLIGAYWYVDYFRDVHFFITETADAPDPIVGPPSTVQMITRATDNTQNRTQVFVTGQGTQTTVDVAAGAGLTVPVEDAEPFSASGGLLRSDTLQLTYTGRALGGGVSTVRGAPAPTATVGVFSASGIGGILGPTNYRVSFKSDAGETAPGPPSSTVTGVAFAAPTGGAAINASAGIGTLIGTYRYGMTWVTDRGETTANTYPPFTAAAVATPTFPSVVSANGSSWEVGVLVGAYSYEVTFVTPEGETLASAPNGRTAIALSIVGLTPTAATQPSNTIGPLVAGAAYKWALTAVTAYGETLIGSSSSSLTIASIFTPAAPSNATLSAGGSVPTGNVQYAVCFVTGDGLTSALGAASVFFTISSGNQIVTVLGIPTGPTGITGRRIYRKYSAGANFLYLGELTNNVDTSFVYDHDTATATAPTTGTIGGRASVSPQVQAGINTVLSRRLYRTKANGTTYYRIAEIPDNSTTTPIIDDIPDSTLTQLQPIAPTAGGEQHDIGIPVGPSGTLARRIYRTRSGGTDYRLLTEVPGNTPAVYRDNLPDGSLGGDAPPLVATAGGQNADVQVLAGPAGTIERRLYRSKAGGTDLFLAASLPGPGSGAQIVTDRKTDDELGAAAPAINTAGASRFTLTGIPIGPAGTTARRIYRLDTGLYRFVLELPDNTTTSTIDDRASVDLGDVAPTVSTIGARAGDTSLPLSSGAPFAAGGGWALVGTTPIRYGFLSGSDLGGIPSSGPGALLADVRAGTEVTAAPMLIGVSTLPFALPSGSPIHILVMRESTSAQAAMAAVEGGDGIHQVMIADDLLTLASAATRGDAELLQFATAEQRVTFASRDVKLRSGKSIAITLGAPTNISGTFRIQQVVTTEWGIPHLLPLRTVTASSVLYSFEHFLRRAELGD